MEKADNKGIKLEGAKIDYKVKSKFSNSLSAHVDEESNLIYADWKTFDTNSPKQYGNQIVMWQEQESMPPFEIPADEVITLSPGASGSDPFQSELIAGASYVLAYATGDNQIPKPNKKSDSNDSPSASVFTSYCAYCVIVPNSNGDKPPIEGAVIPKEDDKIQLDLTSLEPHALILKYKTQSKNRPKVYKNWIGLWEGEGFSLDGSRRLKKWDISDDASSKRLVASDVTILANKTYTIVYATGSRDSDIAAYLVFETAPH
jgi:hypothetical protein